MQLTGYFDESYTHAPAPLIYTVGGYVSSVKRWKKFEREWAEALREVDVSFFHMAKFEARKKEYEGWSNEKRVRVLRRLHGIIKERVFVGFACSVNLSDYQEVIKTDELRAYFGNPHVFVTIACMKTIGAWADGQHFREPIAYVFESGSGHDAEVSRLFANAIRDENQRERYRVGSFSIQDKRLILPLQAADILAYEVTKVISWGIDNENMRPVRQSIKNLRLPCFNEWYYYGKVELIELVTSAQERGLLGPPINPS